MAGFFKCLSPQRKKRIACRITLRQTWAIVLAKFLTDPVAWFFLIWLPDFFKKTRGMDLKGGGQSLNFGLDHLDTFAWIGGFSSAPNTEPGAPRVFRVVQRKTGEGIMWKFIGVGTCLLTITAVAVWQGQVIRELRKQVPAADREQPRPSADPGASPARDAPRRERTRAVVMTDEELNGRVTLLEKTVAQLTESSEYLMSRGQLPLASHKRAELEQKVTDLSASDRDRLQALRLLCRNGALSEAMTQRALSWLQSATNSGLREDLVEQLGSATNSLLREPMIKLATSDPDSDVRERAIENLRGAVSDPQSKPCCGISRARTPTTTCVTRPRRRCARDR